MPQVDCKYCLTDSFGLHHKGCPAARVDASGEAIRESRTTDEDYGSVCSCSLGYAGIHEADCLHHPSYGEPVVMEGPEPGQYSTPDGAKLEERPGARGDAKTYDAGKLRLDLVPPELMEAVAEVLGQAAEDKYADWNWAKGMDWSRNYSCALRHILKWYKGEDDVPDTGLHHLAHAITRLMFLLVYAKTHPEYDDRPGMLRQATGKSQIIVDGDVLDLDVTNARWTEREEPAPKKEKRIFGSDIPKGPPEMWPKPFDMGDRIEWRGRLGRIAGCRVDGTYDLFLDDLPGNMKVADQDRVPFSELKRVDEKAEEPPADPQPEEPDHPFKVGDLVEWCGYKGEVIRTEGMPSGTVELILEYGQTKTIALPKQLTLIESAQQEQDVVNMYLDAQNNTLPDSIKRVECHMAECDRERSSSPKKAEMEEKAPAAPPAFKVGDLVEWCGYSGKVIRIDGVPLGTVEVQIDGIGNRPVKMLVFSERLSVEPKFELGDPIEFRGYVGYVHSWVGMSNVRIHIPDLVMDDWTSGCRIVEIRELKKL